MEKLKERAKELGITFDDEITEEDLQKLISEKEAELDEDKDKDFWKTEAQKAFDARDTAKKERKALQQKVKDLEDKLGSTPSANEIEELRKAVKELNDYKAEVEALKEEEDLKNKSDLEKQEISFRKEMEKLTRDMEGKFNKTQKDIEEKEKLISNQTRQIDQLRRATLRGEIIEAATRHSAYNPSQIVTLLSDRFTYDADLDKFAWSVTDSKGKLVDEKTVNETVEEFLKDPVNDNLVKASVNTDGLHTKETIKTTNTKSKKTNSKYDPDDEDLKIEAEEAHMEVSDWIAVKEIKDAKLAKIRGKGQEL